MDIKIIVATHKKYWMPKDDIYIPLHVGHAGKEDLGYAGDDTGENISKKNSTFCELTGMYWAWKNLRADYKGIVHYRRYFTYGNPWLNKKRHILGKRGFQRAFQRSDIVVPDLRNHYIETNRSHYAHAHHLKDLEITRRVISEMFPADVRAFDLVMDRTGAHMFNMMVMRADYFDRYCAWLFAILFEVEKRTDVSQYDSYQKRLYGYLSERLLDVWLEANQMEYQEVNVAYLEHQNWLKKGAKFLWRKFF